MKKVSLAILFLLLILSGLALISCTKDATSAPNFVFKKSTQNGVVAKIGGRDVREGEIIRGIESDIFDAEMKVFELKMHKLRAMLLEYLMNSDPRKKGLTNDQYLEKFITKDAIPSKKEIQAFIVERKIPKQHLNDQMKQRIKQFLGDQKKKKAVEVWLGEKTKNDPIEVYLNKPERPRFNVNITPQDQTYGSKSAKVKIVEFSDFQCPYCSKAALTMKQLKKKYGSKILVVFKNYPLPFHKDAKKASEYGLCANEQSSDNFWKLYYKMFENQSKLDEDSLKGYVKELGLDVDKINKCIVSGKYIAKIESDIKDGEKVGVKSTPTFFINGQLVSGALPVEQFQAIIDEELKK